jgi:N-acetylneuraminic acid mutarotase
MRARTPILLLSLLVALGGALAVGFVGGRRLPHGLLDRIRGRVRGDATDGLQSPWRPMAPAPFQVFEAATTSMNGLVYVFGGFKDVQVHASAAVWVFDPATGAWQRKGDMPHAWTHANPAPLDGAIWFAGGFVGDSPGPATADVWRYDPGADRWTPGPPLPGKRGGGALAAVNGALHYFGGYMEDRETTSGDHWVLVPGGPDSLRWKPAAPLPMPRGHLAGIALGGMIYALGGCIGHDPYPRDVAFVHRYDPAQDRWVARAPMPLPRSHFEPGTFVRNGRIVIVGGRSRPRGEEAVNLVSEYDPAADRWTALPPLPETRHSPVAAAVPGGMIAGVGGTHTSNPDTPVFYRFSDSASWVPGDSLPAPLGEVSGGVIGDRLYLVGQGSQWTLALDLRSGRWEEATRHAVRPATGHHHGAEVWRGRLYLFGGLGRGQGTVQIYDPALDAWRLGPAMPFAAGSSATALIGNQVYVAGGIVDDTTTRMAARFDLEREVWSPIAPMPLARNHAAAGTDGARLFVFGGRGPGSGDANMPANGFAEAQIYDPATDRWTASDGRPGSPAPLPQARGGMGKAAYSNGEFWVFGGETLDGAGAGPEGTYARVDVYDPRTDRWRAAPRMPTPRHGIFPLAADGRIYLLGGGVHSGQSASTVAEILRSPRSPR